VKVVVMYTGVDGPNPLLTGDETAVVVSFSHPKTKGKFTKLKEPFNCQCRLLMFE
jgi:hypothetical protein